MKDIVIYGIGGFGREIMESLEQQNKATKQYRIVGFVDDDKERVGDIINGHSVIGTGEYLEKYETPICVLVGVGSPNIRKQIINRLKQNKMVEFPNFIADSVVLNSELVSMGEGNVICSHNIFTVNITIGNYNIINLQNTIGHDVIIDNYVTIAPGCNISGNVTFKDGCDIGTGSCMKQGVTIGESTVIGMGSVVTKNIPSKVVAFGNPCRIRE